MSAERLRPELHGDVAYCAMRSLTAPAPAAMLPSSNTGSGRCMGLDVGASGLAYLRAGERPAPLETQGERALRGRQEIGRLPAVRPVARSSEAQTPCRAHARTRWTAETPYMVGWIATCPNMALVGSASTAEKKRAPRVMAVSTPRGPVFSRPNCQGGPRYLLETRKNSVPYTRAPHGLPRSLRNEARLASRHGLKTPPTYARVMGSRDE